MKKFRTKEEFMDIYQRAIEIGVTKACKEKHIAYPVLRKFIIRNNLAMPGAVNQENRDNREVKELKEINVVPEINGRDARYEQIIHALQSKNEKLLNQIQRMIRLNQDLMKDLLDAMS